MIAAGTRAVVFDAVGTVIHPDPPAPLVYAAVGRRFGSRLTPEEIAVRFVAAFRAEEARDRADGWRTSEERERQRWRTIVASVLNDVTDPGSCFQELFEHFSRPEAWTCDPEAGPTLEALHERGYELGMASNYDERLRPVVAGLSELRRVTRLVISSEIGWRKPAVPFFLAIGSTLGIDRARILYVGDDLANDYQGASAAGFQALLLDPRRRAPAGVAGIASLNQL
jgi:putative hydrolase of the HAD superfamily